jgi:hypothetical protein
MKLRIVVKAADLVKYEPSANRAKPFLDASCPALRAPNAHLSYEPELRFVVRRLRDLASHCSDVHSSSKRVQVSHPRTRVLTFSVLKYAQRLGDVPKNTQKIVVREPSSCARILLASSQARPARFSRRL